jgi:mycofactocin precursor
MSARMEACGYCAAMNTDVITAAPTAGQPTAGQPATDDLATAEPTTAPVRDENEDLTAEDLIEEVSIDGMCGVY